MNNLVKIEDTDIILIDGDRGVNYPSRNEFYDEGYCLFLDARNITDKGFDFSETHFITEEKDKILRNGKLQRNDIVMMTRGSVGNVALYDETVPYDNIRINSGMIIIRCKKEYDSLQVYYLLKSNFVQKQISDMMSGSVQKQLPVSIINKIKLLNTEIRIDTIYAIDKKIENNNRINRELESMAKTIYDYWFLQFEFPNEDGKPYKSSGGKMVWNEELKREIPEGWRSITIGEITNCLDHKRIPLSGQERKLKTGNIPYYGATGIVDYVDEAIFDGEYVLVAEDGSIMDEKGHPILQRVSGLVWINNHAHVLQPSESHSCKLLMMLLKDVSVMKIKTGSIQMKINQANLNKTPVLNIPEKLITKINEKLEIIDSKILHLGNENQELSSLRDFLLPLLMNGQARFKD